MEDADVTILDLQAEDKSKVFKASSLKDRVSFFGVYDGHTASTVSAYARLNTHKILAEQEAFKQGDFEQALKDGFLATDERMLTGKHLILLVEDRTLPMLIAYVEKYETYTAGSTATVGLITKDKIYVASTADLLRCE